MNPHKNAPDPLFKNCVSIRVVWGADASLLSRSGNPKRHWSDSKCSGMTDAHSFFYLLFLPAVADRRDNFLVPERLPVSIASLANHVRKQTEKRRFGAGPRSAI